MILNRRSFVSLGTAMAATPALAALPKTTGRGDAGPYTDAIPAIEAYVAQYLAELGAPGLTLVLADRVAVRWVGSYGYADIGTRTPVTPDDQFQIGSITKSFVGLALLQLVEEGRVSVHDPIDRHLPGLRFESPDAPITIHHLLTHSAALPDGPLFPGDPSFRHRPAGPLGRDFHYCNMGWRVLGQLIEHLDGSSLAECLQRRLLTPLGMTHTAPVTSFEHATRVIQSYWPARSDRPYPTHGPLVVAPRIMATDGAGCIASTPADMGQYLLILLNGGRLGNRRIVSPEAFAAFSTPHIEAAEFGNNAHYGYGIAVDSFDGHRRLRHTGGMVSFASALEVDTDSGFGVFASVNAMQGVRPRPVTEFALRALRACRERRPMPKFPAPFDPRYVEQVAHYLGIYHNESGQSCEVVQEGAGLALKLGGKEPVKGLISLEPVSGGAGVFVLAGASASADLVVFPPAGTATPANGFGWGSSLYMRMGVSRPQPAPVPSAWHGFVGHYREEEVWTGTHHVILRAGQLWLDGIVPLEPAADGRFWLRDEATSPEWVLFGDVVGGRAMTMKLSGETLVRITSG